MRTTRVLVPALLGLAATFVAVPAHAHDVLLGSTPEPEQHLDEPPTEIELEFSAEPIDIGGGILVVDADGADRATGEPVYDGRTVSVEVDPDLPDGAYEARWRVVSSDGHPIEGSIPFTVGDAADAPTPPAGAPADPPDEADPGPDDAGTDAAAPTDGPSVPWRTVAVGLGGAALAGIAYLALTRRRRAAAGDQDPPPAPGEGSPTPERS
ncbi:MAG: copper resistance CopC family protein [Actinomycetaceae bacterium]